MLCVFVCVLIMRLCVSDSTYLLIIGPSARAPLRFVELRDPCLDLADLPHADTSRTLSKHAFCGTRGMCLRTFGVHAGVTQEEMWAQRCVCVLRNVETVMGVIACLHCVDKMCVFESEKNERASGSNCVRSGMFFQGAVCVV